MIRQVRAIFFGFLFLFLANANSTERPLIIYTGTFDPYHRNHQEQVEAALEAIPGAELKIGIVELSPPSVVTSTSKIELPTLLSYEQRKEIVAASISDLPRVSITDHFRVIPKTMDELIVPGMAQITSKIQAQHRGPIYRLVGTDVFLLWLKDQEFKYWPENVRFIIGFNPELEAEFNELQYMFKGDARFVFVRKQTVQIRSSQLRSEMLKNKLNWSEFLTSGAAKFMNRSYTSAQLSQSLLDRHEMFLQSFLDEDIVKLMPKELFQQIPKSRAERLEWFLKISKERQSDPILSKLFFRARRSIGLIPNVLNYLNNPVVSCRLALLL